MLLTSDSGSVALGLNRGFNVIGPTCTRVVPERRWTSLAITSSVAVFCITERSSQAWTCGLTEKVVQSRPVVSGDCRLSSVK